MNEVSKRGRPRLPDSERKSVSFRVVCTRGQFSTIQNAAHESGITIAELIRLMVFSGGVQNEPVSQPPG